MTSIDEARPAPPRVLFTAPWDPVVVRRGDALGLRAFADVLADAVAPGLNNRIHDARWITILSWCLARSHEVYFASGGRSLLSRREQAARYAWLRPLELMMVARTIHVADDSLGRRLLPGQRSVKYWVKRDDMRTPRMGLSEEQYRRYRNTGIYGAYRLGFRSWRGMTVSGDGFTPGPRVTELARRFDDELGRARLPWKLFSGRDDDGVPSTSAKRCRGSEDGFWLRHWSAFLEHSRNADERTLPRPREEHEELWEASILSPLLFGKEDAAARRRRTIAEAVLEAEDEGADDHAGVCDHLGQKFAHVPGIALLPRFARFADAAVDALLVISRALDGKPSVALDAVQEEDDAHETGKALLEAAAEWLKRPGSELRHIGSVDLLATRLQGTTPKSCYRALLEHHETSGGGLRWFVLRGSTVDARSPSSSSASSYRFRLYALCRLAVQCGVLSDMPEALLNDGNAELAEEDDENGDSDEDE